MQGSKCSLEVSQSALEHNLAVLREAANAGLHVSAARAALLAVIKADAYGHGARLCAPVLARAGAAWLGVTDAAEGVSVREALASEGLPSSNEPRILVMCGLEAADAPLLCEHRLTPVVWFPEQLRWLAASASTGVPLAVHLEIDTGMARQGVRPGNDLDLLLDTLATMPELCLEGVLTHFASAEIVGSPHTALQQSRFAQALGQLDRHHLSPRWLHAGNTSTLEDATLLPWLHRHASQRGMRLLARTGLALYGYSLPLEGGASSLAGQLRPVAEWKTHLIATRLLFRGESVGYNATFTAKESMRMGLLPAGYADGLRRELSSTDHRPGGSVLLHGQLAPILGRVSMNLTVIDVTHLSSAALGDEALLLGPQPGITAHDHARLADTIPYEILCALRGRQTLRP